MQGIVIIFFFNPFEKTVTWPWLFRPALFLKKNLKKRFTFLNLIKNVLFVNLCVVVVGLCNLVKILINKY